MLKGNRSDSIFFHQRLSKGLRFRSYLGLFLVGMTSTACGTITNDKVETIAAADKSSGSSNAQTESEGAVQSEADYRCPAASNILPVDRSFSASETYGE